MQRGIVTGVAALALAGPASAAGTAAAGPVRMCDGDRGVIANEVSCAHAFWLADHARAGKRITGWRASGNSAGVVRLRQGRAWVKVRRVARESVAALLIIGLRIERKQGPAADGSSGRDALVFCSLGRVRARSDFDSGVSGTPPGPVISAASSHYATGSWAPAFVGEWRGGRTLEAQTSMQGGFNGEWIALAPSQRVRMELRDDGTGTLTTAAAAPVPVTWGRTGNSCPSSSAL